MNETQEVVSIPEAIIKKPVIGRPRDAKRKAKRKTQKASRKKNRP